MANLPSLQMSAAGNSVSSGMPMKASIFQFGGGISCLMNFSAGANLTATLQVTNDPNGNPANTPAVQNTARWQNHDILQGITASKNSSIVYPVAYARLVVTNYISGTVTVDFGVPDYAL